MRELLILLTLSGLLANIHSSDPPPKEAVHLHAFYNTHTDFSDHQAYYNGSHMYILYDTDAKKKSESYIRQLVTSDFQTWHDKGNLNMRENIRLEYLVPHTTNTSTNNSSTQLLLGYYFFKHNVETDAVAYSADNGNTWKAAGNIPSVNILSFLTPMWDEANNYWIAVTDDYEVATSHDLQNWDIGLDLPRELFQVGFVEELFSLQISYNVQGTTVWVAFIKTDYGTLYQPMLYLSKTNFTVLDHADIFDYGPDFFELAIANGDIKNAKERLAAGTILNQYYSTNSIQDYPSLILSSIPRLIYIEEYCYRLKLRQRPAVLWTTLGTPKTFKHTSLTGPNHIILHDGPKLDTFSLYAEFYVGTSHEVGFKLLDDDTHGITIGYKSLSKEAFLNRSSAHFPEHADPNKRDQYFQVYSAPIWPLKGLVQVDIFVDGITVEVFFNTDEVAFTAIVFSSPSANKISIYSTQGTTEIALIKINMIK